MTKVYCGTLEKTRLGGRIVLVNPGPHQYKLNPRHDLRDHSPTGFMWGYGGSGPAQLALALLADALGDDVATQWYQKFKWGVVAGLDVNEPWEIAHEAIVQWYKERSENAKDK